MARTHDIASHLRTASVQALVELGVTLDEDRSWQIVDEVTPAWADGDLHLPASFDVELSLPAGVRRAPGDGRLWVFAVGTLLEGGAENPSASPGRRPLAVPLRAQLAEARRVPFARARWEQLIDHLCAQTVDLTTAAWTRALRSLDLAHRWSDALTVEVGEGSDRSTCVLTVGGGVGTFTPRG